MPYYSQYKQDQYLYENYFSKYVKSSGVFVEVGADDGIRNSNSLYFEEELGWTGVCIEPRPSIFPDLQKNRKSTALNFAVSHEEGMLEFVDITGYGRQLSGLLNNYDPQHLERIEKESENPNFVKKEVVTVEARSLSRIFKDEYIGRVNFLSIDTEGSEISALKSIDFDAVVIDVIMIENNYKEDYRSAVTELDERFILAENIQHDEIYVRKGLYDEEPQITIHKA
jgi:FkbM family methyltransferase